MVCAHTYVILPLSVRKEFGEALCLLLPSLQRADLDVTLYGLSYAAQLEILYLRMCTDLATESGSTDDTFQKLKDTPALWRLESGLLTRLDWS